MSASAKPYRKGSGGWLRSWTGVVAPAVDPGAEPVTAAGNGNGNGEGERRPPRSGMFRRIPTLGSMARAAALRTRAALLSAEPTVHCGSAAYTTAIAPCARA